MLWLIETVFRNVFFFMGEIVMKAMIKSHDEANWGDLNLNVQIEVRRFQVGTQDGRL